MHEFQHASDYVTEEFTKETKRNPEGNIRDYGEVRALEAQNVIRRINGEKPRTYYGGKKLLNDDGSRQENNETSKE